MDRGLPYWVLIVLAVATPLLAFGGALIGQVVARKGAREQEVRWQREESMRLLRWGAELAADSQEERNAMGAAALRALSRSALLQDVDRVLIFAILDVVVDRAGGAYHEGDRLEVE